MAFPLTYHRITNSYFRTCSTRRSRSQVGLCVCTLCTISVRAEPTFERLRYAFGGDRPSQTAHLTVRPQRAVRFSCQIFVEEQTGTFVGEKDVYKRQPYDDGVGVHCTAGCLLRGMGICSQDGVRLYRFLNIEGRCV